MMQVHSALNKFTDPVALGKKTAEVWRRAQCNLLSGLKNDYEAKARQHGELLQRITEVIALRNMLKRGIRIELKFNSFSLR